MDIILVALLGYVFGGIFRTVYDFLWKNLADPSVTFDSKYWATMIISTILSTISALVTFSAFIIPSGDPMYVFTVSLTTGFMINHLVNKPVDYLSKKAS